LKEFLRNEREIVTVTAEIGVQVTGEVTVGYCFANKRLPIPIRVKE